MAISFDNLKHLKISGDGSRIFLQTGIYIRALDIQAGEVVGEVMADGAQFFGPLIVNGSKVGACIFDERKQTQWWDFGVPGSTPIQLSNMPLERPHLQFICYPKLFKDMLSHIKDTVNRRVIFWFFGRCAGYSDIQWDGRYLVAGYESGEVLLLDFNHMPLQ